MGFENKQMLEARCSHHGCDELAKTGLDYEHSHGGGWSWACEAHQECLKKELEAKGYTVYMEQEIKCPTCSGTGKIKKGARPD